MSTAVVELEPACDPYSDPHAVLAAARSYGPLRAVEPGEQAAIVREAVNYDASLLPRWQRGGEGVHALATPQDYARGVHWVPTKKPVRAEDGRMYYFRKVASGVPHLPWRSRDHWLQVLLPEALDLRPETWRGVIARDEVIRIMTTATTIAHESTGRACIARLDRLGELCDVSEQKVRRCWDVVRQLGLAVLMVPGRMLDANERYKAWQGGSRQRGLANEWAFVTPARAPRDLMTTTPKPVRPPLRLVGPQTASTADATLKGAQIGSQGLTGTISGDNGVSEVPAENSPVGEVRPAPAVDRNVGTVTPARGIREIPSSARFRSALGREKRSAGGTEPAPPAHALKRRGGNRSQIRLEQVQTGSQRAQAGAGASPNATGAASGRRHLERGRGHAGRVYDRGALTAARDLIELLPWLTGVPAGRLETLLRRFTSAALPWTARDIVAAIAAANRRNGRSELPLTGVRAPIAFLASLVRDLDVDADHPRLDPLDEHQALRPESVSQRVRENRALVERAREARAAGLSPAQVLVPTTPDRAAAAAAGIRDELAARRTQRASKNSPANEGRR